jgi:ankyrin repeat protein
MESRRMGNEHLGKRYGFSFASGLAAGVCMLVLGVGMLPKEVPVLAAAVVVRKEAASGTKLIAVSESRLEALAIVETTPRRFCGDDLAEAIRKGDQALVTAFLDAGWGVDQPLDYRGTRPLHEAAAYDQSEIARLLLARGGDPNVSDSRGRTPLIQSAKSGSAAVAEVLLDAGAGVNQGWNGRTAVHAAAMDKKSLDVLRVLLAHGGDPGRPDRDGVTPLMEAALRGLNRNLAALLERADPAALARHDKWDQTVLRRALSNEAGKTPTVRLLLAAGADPVSTGSRKTDLEWAWEIRSPATPDLEAAVLGRDPLAAGALLAPAILYDRMEFATALQAAGVAAAGLDRRVRLFLAAATGDTATLTAALADGDVLSIEDARHETLMARAARRGQGEAVRLLLGEWARRQATRSEPPPKTWNCPALLAAAEGGDARVVQNLLAAGADPNTYDFLGFRPLHHAARLDYLAVATVLLAHGADPNAATSMRATPLELAARAGDPRLVQVLLAAGAAVDGPGQGGVTPLLAAVETGRIDVIPLLTTAGANPYRAPRWEDGCAALVAAQSGDPALVDAVAPACTRAMFEAASAEDIEAGVNFACRSLFAAIAAGQTEIVRSLLRVGMRPDIGAGDHTRLPLAEAAARRQVDVLRALIAAGFDVNESYQDWTVLMNAAVHPSCWQSTAYGDLPGECRSFADLPPDPDARTVVGMLVEAGADVNARSADGRTALLVTADRGGPEAAAALAAAGAQMEFEDGDGYTALVIAARVGNGPVVAALLDAGASPEGGRGGPALCAACEAGHWDIARLLLRHGAKPDGRPAEGDQTPLMWAAYHGNDKLMEELLAAGADPWCQQAGQTALSLAARAGHRKMARRIYQVQYASPPVIEPSPWPDPADPEIWPVEDADEYPRIHEDGAEDEQVDIGRLRFDPDRYGLDSIRVGEIAEVEALIRAGYLRRLGSPAEEALLEAVRFREYGILRLILNAQTAAWRRVSRIPADTGDESAQSLRRWADDFGRIALAAAIFQDDAQSAEMLLQAGVDARGPYSIGLTPLHLAADQGPALIRLLLGHGANVDARTEPVAGWQLQSVGSGAGEQGESFSSGEEPSLRDVPGGVTPLFLALRSGRAETAELLIRAGHREGPLEEFRMPDPTAGGRTLLEDAAWRGEVKRVRLLLDFGADPNLADDGGRTALMTAAESGSLGTVKVLLAGGADPAKVDGQGRTAWHLAAARLQVEVIRALAAAGARPPASGTSRPILPWYVRNLEEDREPYDLQLWTLSTLLLAGADPGGADERGCTGLVWACSRNWREVAELLLGYGANPDQADADGRTPLLHAIVDDHDKPVYEERLELIDLLVKAGADIRRRDRSGCSPLDWANTLRSRQLINVLFQEEIFPDAWRERGNIRVFRSSGR